MATPPEAAQPMLEANVDALADFVRRHPRLLVLTGAGCSTESGIPDWRDDAGQWKRSDPIRYQDFMASHATRQRYWARSLLGWPLMAQARPGPAHHALARLEAAGHVQLLVTQNVDGLHQAAGSRAVVDLHGRIDTVCCTACGQRNPRAQWQAELAARNPEWAGLAAEVGPDGDAHLDGRDFASVDVPACPHCGGLLKPDVVFFGESVPRERVLAARAALAQSDALLVAGSSLMVYSGFRFVQEAVAAGQPVVLVNRGTTRADALATRKFGASAGELLTRLADALVGPVTPA